MCGVFEEQQTEKKRPLRAQRKWEYIIKMGLQKLGWGTCTGLIWFWIGTGGGGEGGTRECGNEPLGSI